MDAKTARELSKNSEGTYKKYLNSAFKEIEKTAQAGDLEVWVELPQIESMETRFRNELKDLGYRLISTHTGKVLVQF